MKLSEIKQLIKEEVNKKPYTKNYQILHVVKEQKSDNIIYVSSDDKFKVKHGGKTWIVQYENHEEGDPITLKSGKETVTGKVIEVTPKGDLTIKL